MDKLLARILDETPLESLSSVQQSSDSSMQDNTTLCTATRTISLSSRNENRDKKLIKPGCIALLKELKTLKYNDLPVLVVSLSSDSDRVVVSLIQEPQKQLKIKAANLFAACSSCFNIDQQLHRCKKCQTAAYCSRHCQEADWKAHKSSCKQLKKQLSEHARPVANHASWSRLTFQQRLQLQEAHERVGCTVPWPLTCETDDMLRGFAPSFLQCHPNQRFKVAMCELPSFLMQYDRDPNSELNGRTFPAGKILPTLREDLDAFCGSNQPFEEKAEETKNLDTRMYFQNVPPHMPVQMCFAVIGEVRFSTLDYIMFKDYYDRQSSKFLNFRWPGIEAIVTCPGTGEEVKPHPRKIHLLVACEIAGGFTSASALNSLTRILPRILTLDGYEKMMGPQGKHRSVKKQKIVTTANGSLSPKVLQQEVIFEDFYPTALQSLQGGVMNASEAWEKFHSEGFYLAFEKLMKDERKQQYSKHFQVYDS